ncbi:hypothetical protein E4U43_001163 [Claviceps pusilla]|uniref:Uncharacterized protein n=1 Tax=Claviceps pusilla TaxID=123648 RepID=A0A9P7N872_9HYPO|nr:hypothetical protein E4U43_001163 [Claviceps pusilla]
MPADSLANESSRSHSTHEVESRRWSSSLSKASVPSSCASESEPPIIVPTKSAMRNSKTLSSSTEGSVAPGVQKSSCSVSGTQASAARSRSSYHGSTSEQSCSAASSPGLPEVGCQQHVSECDASLEGAEKSYASPTPARKEMISSRNVSEGQAGAEQVDRSIVECMSPQPPYKGRLMSQIKNIVRVADFMTGNIANSKRCSFLFQLRRRSEPVSKRGTSVEASSASVSPRSPAQSEKKRQRRSFAGSASSGYSVHTPSSKHYTFCPNATGTSGWVTSFDTRLAAEPHNTVSPLSTTRRDDACKRNPGRPEMPYTLAVVIPDGKLFEDELDLQDLFSV